MTGEAAASPRAHGLRRWPRVDLWRAFATSPTAVEATMASPRAFVAAGKAPRRRQEPSPALQGLSWPAGRATFPDLVRVFAALHVPGKAAMASLRAFATIPDNGKATLAQFGRGFVPILCAYLIKSSEYSQLISSLSHAIFDGLTTSTSPSSTALAMAS
ncbi:hypothetical protein NL676_027796 [Syzygium grande]|nr:hypothetical protein NL676_027796 [Syzygium grande]